MIEFLKSTVEYQNLGWNWLTVGALGTIILSMLQGWSTLLQALRIWRDKKADSLSVELFSNLFWYQSAYFFYGMHKQSLAIMFSGTIAICYFPVVVGLWRFRESLTRVEWTVSLILPFMVPAMIYAPNKDIALGVFMAIGVLFVLDQIRKIWREGPGELEPLVLYVFIASSFFWILYGLAIGKHIIWVPNSFGLVALLGMLGVWKWKKRVT